MRGCITVASAMQLQQVRKKIVEATAVRVAMCDSFYSSRAYSSNAVVQPVVLPHCSTIHLCACTRWPLKCLDGRQVVNRSGAKHLKNCDGLRAHKGAKTDYVRAAITTTPHQYTVTSNDMAAAGPVEGHG